MLETEHDENVVRMSFAPFEVYDITEAMWDEIETDSKARQGNLGKPHLNGGTSRKLREVDPTGALWTIDQQRQAKRRRDDETNVKLASKVGVGARTLDKIRAVVEAAKAEPGSPSGAERDHVRG